jgi:hypothetical protein
MGIGSYYKKKPFVMKEELLKLFPAEEGMV